jgi:hypothetical protein
MKKRKLIYAFSTMLFLSSCSQSFYQLYSVKPNQESITKTENLFFEDDNCKISYNLWANGGDIGFDIYNKTDEKINVNLNECNFILNGFAYDYYKNRTFTTSKSKTASTSKTATSSAAVTGINVNNNIQTNQVIGSNSANSSSHTEYSVTIKEDMIIAVPAKTTKRISEYSINNTLIRDCDLFKYPSIKKINTKSYTIEQSPIVFSNVITYEIKGERVTVKNEFYVSEITNYPSAEFWEYKYDEYCGQKSWSKTKFIKFREFNKFYIQYDKGDDFWNH